MDKSLMLTVVAWNDLFWVALRVCKISGLSGLSFPRFRLRTPTRPPRPSMNRVKVVPFNFYSTPNIQKRA